MTIDECKTDEQFIAIDLLHIHSVQSFSKMVWRVSDYHIAFGGVFNGLDHFQSLFETHLLDHICPNGAELLQMTEKMSERAI